MARSPGRRTLLVLCALLAALVLLPLGSRAIATRYHDDSLWANSLRSLGGVARPYDLEVFLDAAKAVRRGESPYVAPDSVSEQGDSPYVYPPVLAVALVPATALRDEVAGSSPAGVLHSLLLVASVVGALLLLGVRDWRCYPVALLYPVTLENIEYGALGPVLALLAALGWRYRDRAVRAAIAVGLAVVLKLFLWPLVLWLAATRRWRAAAGAVVTALGLALLSWAAIGFDGLSRYPQLLRSLSDLEAENSYSTYAVLRALGLPTGVAQTFAAAGGIALLALAWHSARSAGDSRDRDRRSLILALAAGFVLTPILWLHYLVLLVVPIALARPRLSPLWFVPLAMTVFELLDWYRGWPRGDGWALASVAVVVAAVFVFSLRTGPRSRQASPGAPARA